MQRLKDGKTTEKTTVMAMQMHMRTQIKVPCQRICTARVTTNKKEIFLTLERASGTQAPIPHRLLLRQRPQPQITPTSPRPRPPSRPRLRHPHQSTRTTNRNLRTGTPKQTPHRSTPHLHNRNHSRHKLRNRHRRPPANRQTQTLHPTHNQRTPSLNGTDRDNPTN